MHLALNELSKTFATIYYPKVVDGFLIIVISSSLAALRAVERPHQQSCQDLLHRILINTAELRKQGV